MTIVGFMSSGFKPFKSENYDWLQENQNDDTDFLLPSIKPENYTPTTIPFTGKYFIAFKEAIGKRYCIWGIIFRFYCW